MTSARWEGSGIAVYPGFRKSDEVRMVRVDEIRQKDRTARRQQRPDVEGTDSEGVTRTRIWMDVASKK